MLSSALIFLLSLALLANSLCVINHMTSKTSHLARIFYTTTATWALLCLLVVPSTDWPWVWLYSGFVVFHLTYQPQFVTDRHIPWLFGDDQHRRNQ